MEKLRLWDYNETLKHFLHHLLSINIIEMSPKKKGFYVFCFFCICMLVLPFLFLLLAFSFSSLFLCSWVCEFSFFAYFCTLKCKFKEMGQGKKWEEKIWTSFPTSSRHSTWTFLYSIWQHHAMHILCETWINPH